MFTDLTDLTDLSQQLQNALPFHDGLPPELINKLHCQLPNTGLFESPATLRSFFTDSRLHQWQNGLPECNNRADRVQQLVDYLHDKATDKGQNALLLFLQVVIGQLVIGQHQDSVWQAQYCRVLLSRHQHLDFIGIYDNDTPPIPLPELFIELETEVIEQKGAAPKGDSPNVKAQEERSIRHTRRLSLPQALQEQPHLLLLGEPGAGKTTTLLYLTLAFAGDGQARTQLQLSETEQRLPIFIRLVEYAPYAQTQPLFQYLEQLAKAYELPDPPAHFWQSQLENGSCCLCLDGLDELEATGQRSVVQERIAALLHSYPANRYLISSRIVGYKTQQFPEKLLRPHTIQPFDPHQIGQFLTKWYEARTPTPQTKAAQQANELAAALQANPHIARIANNPLLLTILALVHQPGSPLPNTRVTLYESCVQTLLETWQRAKKRSPADAPNPTQPHWQRLLQKLAHHLHTQTDEKMYKMGQTQQIKEGSLQTLLCQWLQEQTDLKPALAKLEAEQFLAQLPPRSGLLHKEGRRPDTYYRFSHLTFQEYLTAKELVDQAVESRQPGETFWQAIAPHLTSPHWQEVIPMALACLRSYDTLQAESLVQRILHTPGHDPEGLTHLATRILIEGLPLSRALQKTIIDREITFVKGPKYRAVSFQLLGQLQGNSYAIGQLTTLARDKSVDGWVRRAAAEAVGRLGEKGVAIELLTGMARDERVESGVREAAAEAVGRLGEKAIEPLTDLARDERVESGVRWAAAEALGRLGEKGVAIELLTGLARDERVESWMRSSAAEAVGRLGEKGVAIGLLTGLARDKRVENEVRRAAAEALGRLGEKAIEPLSAIARDERVESEVRCRAAEALGRLGEKAIEPLSAIARDERVESEVRCRAAEALGELGEKRVAIDLLTGLAKDKRVENEVRRAAAEAVGRLGEKGVAIELLTGMARDERVESGVRWAAAEALGRLGKKGVAIELLTGMARDERVESGVRWVAAATLGRLGEKGVAIELLTGMARDERVESGVREEAAEAVGRLGEKGVAIELLTGMARDERVESEVREEAAEALGRLGEKGVAIELLTGLARDERVESGVRWAAVEALGRLGEKAIEPLIAMARDERVESWVRCRAAEALGRLVEKGVAIELLTGLVRDKRVESWVRREAAKALGRLGEKWLRRKG